MSLRQLVASLFVFTSAITLGATTSGADSHGSATWDQARVSGIAAKLPTAAEALYTALYEQGQPMGMVGGVGGDSYHEFRDRVRLLRSESVHLSKELEKGKGRDETRHSFQRISELNRDAAEYGRQQFATNPVISKFSAVEDLIRQLDPYYAK